MRAAVSPSLEPGGADRVRLPGRTGVSALPVGLRRRSISQALDLPGSPRPPSIAIDDYSSPVSARRKLTPASGKAFKGA